MYTSQLRTLCNALIKTGRDKFNLSMGIVSHIEGDLYEIVAVSSATGVFVTGEKFDLNDTYCRQVYEQKKTIALTEIEGVTGLQYHPLYETLSLESYISSPIFVAGSVWGTINFSSMRLRKNAFTNEDIDYIEAAAKTISKVIASGN